MAQGSEAEASSVCFAAAALDSITFVDSYRKLGSKDCLYSNLLTLLRSNPKLVAYVLSSESASGRTYADMHQIIVCSLFGDGLVPEDRDLLLHLIKELIAVQVAPSDQPRRLLRHGTCSFSRVVKMFQESLSSAKLFLISSLRDAVISVLAEDDLYLDVDAERAVARFPAEERIRHFGQEGSPGYQDKLKAYKSFATDKLQTLVGKFVKGIQSSMFCFPEHLRWVIRELFAVLTAGNRLTEEEIGALCTDLVFGHFICHATMNPEIYGIIDMHITSIARFNLMQVAQVLQVLAMSKFEKIDPRFSDICSQFDSDNNNLSNIIDILIESGSNESLCPVDNISRSLKDVTRKCVLISEEQLYSLTNFLHEVSDLSSDDDLKASLTSLLTGIPKNNTRKLPPSTEETHDRKKALLETVKRTKSLLNGSDSQVDNHCNPTEILVIPIGNEVEQTLPGMMTEEKVLEVEGQRRQVKVRMNLESSLLNNEETESVASGSCLSEKRTRFSQDQESIGTSDNLEAISEGASTHSVESSLDTEDEDVQNENDADNLSDMVSANVSSGRATPNVSGRDTPSSHSSNEGDRPAEGPAPPAGQVVQANVQAPPPQPSIRQQPSLNSIPVAPPGRSGTQNDIEEKFGKFDCKPTTTISLSADETKSLLSDTWSTDVLASDTEGIEHQDPLMMAAAYHAAGLNHLNPLMGTHHLHPHGMGFDVSETASQSDAWSTDVLASDTERLQEFDLEDTGIATEGDASTGCEPSPDAEGAVGGQGVLLRHATATTRNNSGESEPDALDSMTMQTLGRISLDLRQKHLKDEEALDMLSFKNEKRTSLSELLSLEPSSSAVLPDKDTAEKQSFSLIEFEKEIGAVEASSSGNLIDFGDAPVIIRPKTAGEETSSRTSETSITGSALSDSKLAPEPVVTRASTGAIPKIPIHLRGKRPGIGGRALSMDSGDDSNRRSRGGFFKLPNIKNKFQEKMKSFKDKRSSQSHAAEEPVKTNGASEGDMNHRTESSDDILAKYRKRSSSSAENEGGDATSQKVTDAVNSESVSVTSTGFQSKAGTIGSTKRKLRKVLSSVDIHGLPISCIQSISGSTSDAHSELIMFLRLLLSESKHLGNSVQVVALQEAIRCVESLDEKSCQQLFWSLREDYQRRSPYISYLIRSRQKLLSMEAVFESLFDHLSQEKSTCLHNLTSVCTKYFLEKKEKALSSFIRFFQRAVVPDEKVQLVEKFLEYLYKCLESDPVWQMASEDVVDHSRLVIERAVMSQIYMIALFPNGDVDVLRDKVLSQHINRLSRVATLSHKDLKIPKIYHSEAPWPSAQEEILTINAYKTPKEKVQCVVRTCNIIMSLLSLATDRSVPAADDFMPVLVYVLIQANPPSLLSTVQYVSSFYDSHFEGEEAYWWTQFSSVIEFIKTME